MKKDRLVFGFGRNDADYAVTTNAVIEGSRKIMWICPLYRAWKDMLTRCYSAKYHESRPTYIDCEVAPEWASFSAFRSWAAQQDYEGKQLDKDILQPGNKVYSPKSCVFVLCAINTFLNDGGAARGECPIGVSWSKKMWKFRAVCRNPFTRKQDHLGYFTCPVAAHEAWKARKHLHACTYAAQQTDPRIAQALCSRYA